MHVISTSQCIPVVGIAVRVAVGGTVADVVTSEKFNVVFSLQKLDSLQQTYRTRESSVS